jgi:hypothetical protein
MGEDERGAGDVADFAEAGGDVLEGAPAAGEQGKPAFSQAAQGTLDGDASADTVTAKYKARLYGSARWDGVFMVSLSATAMMFLSRCPWP